MKKQIKNERREIFVVQRSEASDFAIILKRSIGCEAVLVIP